jgi:hypothetical protein
MTLALPLTFSWSFFSSVLVVDWFENCRPMRAFGNSFGNTKDTTYLMCFSTVALATVMR